MTLPDDLKLKILNEILIKKQISNLDSKLIEKKINKYCLTNGDIVKELKKVYINQKDKSKINKNKYFKQIVKDVRSEIGQIYGQFLTSNFSGKDNSLNNVISYEQSVALLKLHKSTRERFDYYCEVYQQIFEWFKPKKIIDLCCGLNPLSYYYIESELKYKPEYIAIDLNPLDMSFIKKYFEKFDIKGYSVNYDVSELEFLNYKYIDGIDLVFLFKALDSVETSKRNVSKELLLKIPCSKIVISFPLKSLISKKNIKSEKRNWLIKYIENMSWTYQTFEIENEIFYLITKN